MTRFTLFASAILSASAAELSPYEADDSILADPFVPIAHTERTPWMNLKATPEERAKLLVANMTQDEKLNLFHGSCGGYVGNVCANPRLGIPALKMNDGPQGFRGEHGKSTAWPSGLTMAASWDVEAMSIWGVVQGEEFFAKGSNVQLGPGLCVARVPQNGRNFEYLSGEGVCVRVRVRVRAKVSWSLCVADPFLGYTLVQPVIKGIQSKGVVS
jgi:beta-glucosidase